MEWPENAEQMSETNLTVDQAVYLIIEMSKIHEAEVLYNDIYPNNYHHPGDNERSLVGLLVRKTGCGMWPENSLFNWYTCLQIQ